jgi:hypothetical protein
VRILIGVQYVNAFLEALETHATIGEEVRGPQLALDSPCTGWSVRDVMIHSIGVTLKFADFAAGITDHPRSPRGDLVGPDHRLALRTTAVAERAVWASAEMTRSGHLSFGTFSSHRPPSSRFSSSPRRPTPLSARRPSHPAQTNP